MTLRFRLLDLDNPRLGSVSSQSEALASLVRLNPGHFRNMMASIRDTMPVPTDSLTFLGGETSQICFDEGQTLSYMEVLTWRSYCFL